MLSPGTARTLSMPTGLRSSAGKPRIWLTEQVLHRAIYTEHFVLCRSIDTFGSAEKSPPGDLHLAICKGSFLFAKCCHGLTHAMQLSLQLQFSD